MTLLNRVKIANRLTTDKYDAELRELIEEAKADLAMQGNTQAEEELDPNIRKAIVTYCCIHHGQREDREMLQKAYDDLKARMNTCTGYTRWGTEGEEDDNLGCMLPCHR